MLLLALVLTVSGFVNNTAVVAVFMPVAIHLARHYRFSPSKLLLPLSWAAILGGMCTLFGTSTNIVVNSLSPIGDLGVFEFARFGLVMVFVGFLYIAGVVFRYLPSRTVLSSLTRQYHLAGYLTELKAPLGSRLIGRTVTNAMVFGPGNYRFMDYVKFGLPLNVAFWLLGTALIPVVWPF